MTVRRAILTGVLMSMLAYAGKFNCGFGGMGGQDRVQLSIPHPPDALLKAKNLRVILDFTGNFPRAEQLRQQVEQALGKEFVFTDPNPDATIKISVTSYERAAPRQYTKNESRSIKVGEKPIYDKNGKQTGTQDVFAERVVPVEYWTASAGLKVSASVGDKTGAQIDAFNPQGVFNENRELSVNGQSQRGAMSLPSTDQIESMMMSQVSGNFRRRYTATFDTVAVILGCDDELRQANKLAQAGQWKQALDTWKAAKVKKNPGDQTFNIAVATEAMAYAEYARTQNLEDMLPLFKNAMDLYEQALNADPQEKYMRQQRDRLKVAQANIENVRKQYELQVAEAKKAEEAAQKIIEAQMAEQRRKAEFEKAIEDTSPDSPEEAKFRPIARARVAAAQGDITEEQKQSLMGLGQRNYGLNELKSYRVVGQEIVRKKALGQKLKDYDETFSAFAADGKLTADERAQLRDLEKTMGLEDAEVQSLESKYTFKDETKVAATPPKTPTAAPPAKKAATTVPPPAKKTTSTSTPAVTPAAATPTTAPKPGISSPKKQDTKKQDEKKQDEKK